MAERGGEGEEGEGEGEGGGEEGGEEDLLLCLLCIWMHVFTKRDNATK